MWKRAWGGIFASAVFIAAIATVAQWGWLGRALRSTAPIPAWIIALLLGLAAGGVFLGRHRRTSPGPVGIEGGSTNTLPPPSERLMARWPEFRAKIDYLSEFYTTSHPRSIQFLLRGINHSDTSLNSREQRLLSGLLDVMHQLTLSLRYRAESPPTTHKEAVMLIRDFEHLLGVPERSGLDDVLRSLPFAPSWDEYRENYLKDTDLLQRTYREFGREVNLQVGDKSLFSVW